VMESNQKEHRALTLTDWVFLISMGLLGLAVPSSMLSRFYGIEKSPFIKIKAEITQVQGNDIYLRSPELPMKGAKIFVEDSAAGRLKEGESICVQYKNIQAGFGVESDPQYGVEICE
jgi:hypothetical protein